MVENKVKTKRSKASKPAVKQMASQSLLDKYNI